MPELPEVETMRRGILSIVGARIERIERLPCPRRPITLSHPIATMRRRLESQSIVAVDRVGKKVVIRTENSQRLIFEPRMTGLVLTSSPPSQEHCRLRVSLRQGQKKSELLYWDRRGLGLIYCLSEGEYATQLAKWNLGPDACEISGDEFRQRLARTDRPIKVALLDQALLAGIGNLYASEILHRAKISPARPASELSPREFGRIYRALQVVLEEAIRYEGSTLADGTYRNALNQSGSYQNAHAVYDREGETCSTCRRAVIRRIVQAQRSTFFCPACQGG